MKLPFDLEFTDDARADLRQIPNRAILEKIAARLEFLRMNPELGKPLRGTLAGLRSLRAIKSRYRIIYSVEMDHLIIFVIAVGLRQGMEAGDVYKRLERIMEETGTGNGKSAKEAK